MYGPCCRDGVTVSGTYVDGRRVLAATNLPHVSDAERYPAQGREHPQESTSAKIVPLQLVPACYRTPVRLRPLVSAGVAIAVLVAAACGQSSLEDDVEVTISGALTMPDGSPAADVPVGLVKQPGAGSALFEAALLVGSVGTLCLARALTICDDGWTTETDKTGRFSFTMRGSDTKTTFGNASTFVLAAELPARDGQAAGPAVQTRFEVDQAEITTPELSFWEPAQLSVEPGPHWVSYSGVEFDRGSHGYEVVVTDGDALVWSEPGQPEGRLDARTVADADAAFGVTTMADQEAGGLRFTTSYHSQRLPLRGIAGPPASRLAGCRVGEPAEPVTGGCPVTDGQFSNEFPIQSPAPCPSSTAGTAGPCTDENTWVSVDLGAPHRLGAVFVHGLRTFSDTPVAVETSRDGVDWVTHKKGPLVPYVRVALPGGTTAQHVRLRVRAGTGGPPHGRIQSLTEISAWEPW